MRPIVFDTSRAAREFRKLPADAQVKLQAKVRAFAGQQHAGLVKKLAGQSGVRLRAGVYRMIVEETATEVRIVAAGHRRDIYR